MRKGINDEAAQQVKAAIAGLKKRSARETDREFLFVVSALEALQGQLDTLADLMWQHQGDECIRLGSGNAAFLHFTIDEDQYPPPCGMEITIRALGDRTVQLCCFREADVETLGHGFKVLGERLLQLGMPHKEQWKHWLHMTTVAGKKAKELRSIIESLPGDLGQETLTKLLAIADKLDDPYDHAQRAREADPLPEGAGNLGAGNAGPLPKGAGKEES